ncbi:glutaredoxin family protein [Bowmanella denitrificans]|uniref:glutaredoxin family protein n=1 Tax=Bowmanella denitrificans TaxID=366582 RepID=UPI000C9CF678|nr:glutaredoxin family protein [Bowmanella denitrificans]
MHSNLVLYGTVACHLCEEAEALVRAHAPMCALQKVDIMDDDAVFSQYRYSIPVLKDSQGRELCWPFDATQLNEFLS